MSHTRKLWLVSDWFKCLVLFVIRLVCCFLLDYWLSMQSLSFLIMTLVVGFNWVHKHIPDLRQEEWMYSFHRLCIQNKQFRTYVAQHLKEVQLPSTAPERSISLLDLTWMQTFRFKYPGELAYLVNMIAFLIISACSAMT